jgi:hypothetical protein
MSSRFSERIGKKEPRNAIQLDSMDDMLRNSLWNVLNVYIFERLLREDSNYLNSSRFNNLFHGIWFNFLKEPTDQIPSNKFALVDAMRKRFFAWDYLEVYDFIDFLIQGEDDSLPYDYVISGINLVLERELSGYRVINKLLTPITSETEVIEIENAFKNTANNKKYKGAGIHLNAALNKLSDRQNPDYRNSIKESICAIESICKDITNNKKADLALAIKELKRTIQVHPALEQGFLKIYGYTSDGDGIRHALTDEPNLGQEDALFMLVASSAFINYLIAKAGRAAKD